MFFLLCFLIPFESTKLAAIGGVFTAPAGMIVIPFFLIIGFLNLNKINNLERRGVVIFSVFLLYSLIMSLFFITDYEPSFILDRGSRFILIIIPTIIVFFICARQDLETLSKGIWIISSVCLFSLFLSLMFPSTVNNTSFIQISNALSPDRLRGFTFEASTFGFQIVISLMLFSIVNKTSKPLYIIAITFIAFISTSKGTLLCFILSVCIYAILRSHYLLKYILFLVIPFLFIITFDTYVFPLFASDIDNTTSIATRGTMLFTSLISLFNYPLGTGFFGYLPSIYENGLLGIEQFQNVYPEHINFEEVLRYFISGEVKGVSTKTFFFDWVIFAGWPFILLFFYINIKLLNVFLKNDNYSEVICLIFMIISLMTYMSLDARFCIPFAYAFLFLRCKQSLMQNKSI